MNSYLLHNLHENPEIKVLINHDINIMINQLKIVTEKRIRCSEVCILVAQFYGCKTSFVDLYEISWPTASIQPLDTQKGELTV